MVVKISTKLNLSTKHHRIAEIVVKARLSSKKRYKVSLVEVFEYLEKFANNDFVIQTVTKEGKLAHSDLFENKQAKN